LSDLRREITTIPQRNLQPQHNALAGVSEIGYSYCRNPILVAPEERRCQEQET
jgi:hypothetical protein